MIAGVLSRTLPLPIHGRATPAESAGFGGQDVSNVGCLVFWFSFPFTDRLSPRSRPGECLNGSEVPSSQTPPPQLRSVGRVILHYNRRPPASPPPQLRSVERMILHHNRPSPATPPPQLCSVERVILHYNPAPPATPSPRLRQSVCAKLHAVGSGLAASDARPVINLL